MREIRNNAEGAVRSFFKKTFAERNGKPIEAVDYMGEWLTGGSTSLHLLMVPLC